MWYPPDGETSNDSELLFVALLVCQAALDAHKVTELTGWALGPRAASSASPTA